MSALPGEHYCLMHQGNHSHYDKRNCLVCKLTAALEKTLRERDELVNKILAERAAQKTPAPIADLWGSIGG